RWPRAHRADRVHAREHRDLAVYPRPPVVTLVWSTCLGSIQTWREPRARSMNPRSPATGTRLTPKATTPIASKIGRRATRSFGDQYFSLAARWSTRSSSPTARATTVPAVRTSQTASTNQATSIDHKYVGANAA